MKRKKSTRIICIILAILMALSLVISVVPIFANAEGTDELRQEKIEETADSDFTYCLIQTA